jgi:hypothetical protein
MGQVDNKSRTAVGGFKCHNWHIFTAGHEASSLSREALVYRKGGGEREPEAASLHDVMVPFSSGRKGWVRAMRDPATPLQHDDLLLHRSNPQASRLQRAQEQQGGKKGTFQKSQLEKVGHNGWMKRGDPSFAPEVRAIEREGFVLFPAGYNPSVPMCRRNNWVYRRALRQGEGYAYPTQDFAEAAYPGN